MDVIYNTNPALNRSISDEDFLQAINYKGVFSTIQFALKDYNPSKTKRRNPQEVWTSVLKSDRVQWVCRVLAREQETSIDVITGEATKILKEMAYKDHMTLVRMFGYTLVHTLAKLYQEGVFIGQKNIQSIRLALEKNHPVVFMPSHRSYMDFLILSLVCFHFNLPLPAIAAGMDFMKMKGVSTILRASGAFFMRRSFGSDKLYWAIFSEYVHQIITNCDRPIEFFIEGTRSRTGKCLQPKLGLFNLIAEPYIKAQAYDVIIVPVSISYGRVLEEQLYAYELLGVPKPKESTSGLIKAAGILGENFGSLHINFGDLISIRETCSTLSRAAHACYPRYMLRLSEIEQKHLHQLSYKVLHKQQENMVIHLWVVACVFMCQYENGVRIAEMVDKVEWLADILRRWKVNLFVPGGSISDVLHQLFSRHKYLLSVTSVEDKGDFVSIKGFSDNNNSSTVLSRDDIAIRVMLGNYRNQILHVMVRPFLVLLSNSKSLLSHSQSEFSIFKFLRSALFHEFVFEPGCELEDFEEGKSKLNLIGIVSASDEQRKNIGSRADHMLEFLYKCFRPFLYCYVCVCSYLDLYHHSEEMKTLTQKIQTWMQKQIDEEDDFDVTLCEILSLNTISNALNMLADKKAVVFNKIAGKIEVVTKRSEVYNTGVRLKMYLMEPITDEILVTSFRKSPVSSPKL